MGELVRGRPLVRGAVRATAPRSMASSWSRCRAPPPPGRNPSLRRPFSRSPSSLPPHHTARTAARARRACGAPCAPSPRPRPPPPPPPARARRGARRPAHCVRARAAASPPRGPRRARARAWVNPPVLAPTRRPPRARAPCGGEPAPPANWAASPAGPHDPRARGRAWARRGGGGRAAGGGGGGTAPAGAARAYRRAAEAGGRSPFPLPPPTLLAARRRPRVRARRRLSLKIGVDSWKEGSYTFFWRQALRALRSGEVRAAARPLWRAAAAASRRQLQQRPRWRQRWGRFFVRSGGGDGDGARQVAAAAGDGAQERARPRSMCRRGGADAVIFELEAAPRSGGSMVTAAAVLAIGAGAYALSAVASTLRPLDGAMRGSACTAARRRDVCGRRRVHGCVPPLRCRRVCSGTQEARPPSRTPSSSRACQRRRQPVLGCAALARAHAWSPSPWSSRGSQQLPACACGVVAYLRGELTHTARELAYLKSLRYECKSA